MDEHICDTQITRDVFEHALRKYYGNACPKLEKLSPCQIGIGEGIISKIIRVHLIWSNEGKPATRESLPKSVVLKANAQQTSSAFSQLGGSDNSNDRTSKMVNEAMNLEARSYNLLRPLGIVPLPLIYAAEEYRDTYPGFIIMEDLGPKSSISRRLEKPFSVQQLYNLADVLARLHAWSICTQDTEILWKNFGKLEDFGDVLVDFYESFQQGIVSMKRKFPVELEEVEEGKIVPLLDVKKYLNLDNNYIGVVPPVVVHGDFWRNNIMFKLDPSNGSMTDEVYAIIDWQFAYLGSCMTDFGALFPWFPKEFRDTHVVNVLQRYYTLLKSLCQEKFSASFQQLKSLYEQQFALNTLQFFSRAYSAIENETDDKERVANVLVKLTLENYRDAVKILKI